MTETTDPQAAVEERVARHLAAKDWGPDGVPWARDLNGAFCSHYLAAAREVIALVQTPAAPTAAPSAPADRAAILREAAEIAEGLRQFEPAIGARKSAQVSENVGILRVAEELNRMAGEAQQPETRQSCACGQDGCEYCDVDDEPQDDGDVFELPGPEVVAYRNSDRPGVLLCREHGDGWMGLTPLTSDDLPDGGTCTYGDPADPDDVCGRDVLIVVARQADTAGERQ